MMVNDKGEQATEQMFALVGRAITRWSFVENELCSIFMVCTSDVVPMRHGLDFGECAVPNAVFYSVENFRGKLALIDAALGAYVRKWEDWEMAIHADWTKLREKTRKLSLRRNRLAHYMVLPGFDDGDDDLARPPRLVPPYGSPAFMRETGLRPGKLTLSPQHVSHLEYAFFLLEKKLKEFAYRLASQEELFDLYVERLTRRTDSHCRRDPSRAERLRRAISSPE